VPAASQHSAGGVVLADGQVLLIRARNLKGEPVWTLPKGTVGMAETSEAAAVREVEEETGHRCEIVRALPSSSYWFRARGRLIHKTVDWYVMRPLERTGEPDHEVDEVAWLPLAEAAERLTYPSDRKLLKAAGAAMP
jgi:ADP-ribose pyrophosphatase YjhB (NUDIX family)